MIYRYAVRLETEADEVGLIFPDFPEIVSWHPAGSSEAALKEAAADALLVALHARVMENDDIPEPSEVVDAAFHVHARPLAVMKLALYEGLREEGLTRRELAKRLGKSDTIANRLLDLTHKSTVSQLEEAMSALGRDLVIDATATPKSPSDGQAPQHL